MPATGLCYCYFGPFFVTTAASQKKNPKLFGTTMVGGHGKVYGVLDITNVHLVPWSWNQSGNK